MQKSRTAQLYNAVRIVSWNIRSGGGRRRSDIAAQIKRWQPDIVALQEFRATPPSQQLATDLAGWGLIHQLSTAVEVRRAANSLLIASRYPLRKIEHPQAPDDELRWLLTAVSTPIPLTIGVVHVPNRVTKRKYPFLDATLKIAKSWNSKPALLIGDTNSGLNDLDTEGSLFSKQEEAWIHGLEKIGWRDAFRVLKGRERFYTWYSPNAGNGFRLDEAFLNAQALTQLQDIRYEWGVPEKGKVTRRDAVSDHAAIILDLLDV